MPPFKRTLATDLAAAGQMDTDAGKSNEKSPWSFFPFLWSIVLGPLSLRKVQEFKGSRVEEFSRILALSLAFAPLPL